MILLLINLLLDFLQIHKFAFFATQEKMIDALLNSICIAHNPLLKVLTFNSDFFSLYAYI